MSFGELVAHEIHKAFDGEIELREGDEHYSVTMRNETGEGSMLFYRVMPGVDLAYCNFSMDSCVSALTVSNSDILCVDYCRSGRMEQEIGGGAFAYIGAGDLKIDNRKNHMGRFVMPVSEYQGITVSFDVDEARRSLAGELGGFPVDPQSLRQRFCGTGRPFIIHGVASVNHIFSELYSVPDDMRDAYFKIKVLELLLFLGMIDPEEVDASRPYYNRALVQKVKAAHRMMTDDLSRAYTIDEIAKRFEIAPTAFKACFKGVYGEPPHRYVRTLRMEHAAKLLTATDRPISDIALAVGYESPSKFTAAFSEWSGATPSRFRQGL